MALYIYIKLNTLDCVDNITNVYVRNHNAIV